MRTLSETEIQTIKTRLDRCQISYQEVYNELFDHYVSELEHASEEEFPHRKEALDHAFNWSTIRQMEKQQVTLATRDLDKLLLSKISLQIFNKLTMGILVAFGIKLQLVLLHGLSFLCQSHTTDGFCPTCFCSLCLTKHSFFVGTKQSEKGNP